MNRNTATAFVIVAILLCVSVIGIAYDGDYDYKEYAGEEKGNAILPLIGDELPPYEASSIFENGGLKYKIESEAAKTVTVVGYVYICQNLLIPDNIAGYNVTAIGDYAFSGCTELESVTIQGSVTSIGKGIFKGCSQLNVITVDRSGCYFGNDGVLFKNNGDGTTTLIQYPAGKNSSSYDIPENVTVIEDYAFFGCSNLTGEMVIPDSVTHVGCGAFGDCTGLTDITVNGGKSYFDGDGVLFKNNGDGTTTLIQYPAGDDSTSYTIPNDVTVIEDYAFFGCSNLGGVNIPYTVTDIGDYAFFCCSIESVTIYGNPSSIGRGAFSCCSSLTDITVNGGGSYFVDGDVIFKNNGDETTTLIQYPAGDDSTSYTIPNNVTVIEDYAFFYCSYLTTMTIPDSVKTIGDYAFSECDMLSSVTINNGVETIGDYAFCNCNSLTGMTIPGSVKTIGDYAFFNCNSLTGMTIPGSVKTIGDYAFSECGALESVTINNGVETIGDYAFSECVELSSVCISCVSGSKGATIPDNVTIIGDYAFSECGVLSSVDMRRGVKTIGNFAFLSCGLTSVTIPDGVTSIGDYAFCNCSMLKSVAIPNSVTSIGADAFSKCTKLEEIGVASGNDCYSSDKGVLFKNNDDETTTLIQYPAGDDSTSYTIPENVTTIGDYAFGVCTGLTSVTIPDGVTSIGDYAFSNCTGLTGVLTIPGKVTTIGDSAFMGCIGLESVTIPGKVTTIGDSAFMGCIGLESVTIPGEVTTIGDYAFGVCTKLTSVTITLTTSGGFGSILIGGDSNDFGSTWNLPGMTDGIKQITTLIIDTEQKIDLSNVVPFDGKIIIIASDTSKASIGEKQLESGSVYVGNGKSFIEAAFVTFDANGGTPIPATQVIPINEKVTLPAPLTLGKKGYDFDGWYFGNDKWNPDTSVSGNTRLTAHWTAKTYTVTLEAGIGGSDGSATVTYDGGFSPNLNASYVGHTLDGYRLDGSTKIVEANGTFVKNVSGYTDSNGNWIRDGIVTFEAIWIINEFTVTKNIDDIAEFNGTVKLKLSGADKYTKDTTNGVVKFEGVVPGTYEIFFGDLSGGQCEVTGDVSQSTVIDYYTVELTIGTGISAVHGGGTYLKNSSVTLSASSGSGYEWLKWTDTVGGTERSVTNGYVFTITSQQKLTANAKAVSYGVEYRDEGNVLFTGTFEGEQPITHTYGIETTLMSATRTGYTFDGWYGVSECTGDKIGKLAATGYTENITLYVKWIPINYTITFDENGGTDVGDITAPFNTSVNKPAADPSKGNYTFAGWWWCDESGLPTEVNWPVTMTKNGITCFAKWTLNIYYKDQNNAEFTGIHDVGYPTTYTDGTETTLMPATRTGYTFDGWYGDSECTGGKIGKLAATGYTENITLYAKWTTLSTHTVTIESNNTDFGTVSPTQVVDVPNGSKITVSGNKITVNGTEVTATPKTSGTQYTYAFDGWSVENNYVVVGDKTITATFTRTTNYIPTPTPIPTPVPTPTPEPEPQPGTDVKTVSDGTTTGTVTTVTDDEGKVTVKTELKDTATGVETKAVKNDDGAEIKTTIPSSAVKTEEGTVAKVDNSAIESALKQVDLATKDTGIEDVKPVVEIVVTGGDKAETTVEIPAESLKTVAETGADVSISTDSGKVVLDSGAASTITSDKTGDVSIMLGQATHKDLNDDQKTIVGNNTVIKIEASVGESIVHELGGKATISVPYTLKENEDPAKIVIFYLEDSGKMTRMDATYNAETKEVTFETDHFSYYVVAFKESSSSLDMNIVFIAIGVIAVLAIVAALFYYRSRSA